MLNVGLIQMRCEKGAIDEDFPGGGYLFAPDGRRVYATPDWHPGTAWLAIDMVAGQVGELRQRM